MGKKSSKRKRGLPKRLDGKPVKSQKDFLKALDKVIDMVGDNPTTIVDYVASQQDWYAHVIATALIAEYLGDTDE